MLIALTLISTTALVAFHHQSQTYQQRINSTTKQLESDKAKQREQMQEQLQQLQQQNSEKEKQIQDLNSQLQAKRAAQVTLASATRAAVSYVVQPAYASEVGTAKAFIYAKESGNNPGAINSSSGACGLGQALPCSKMPCSLSDYACQDNFFTGYMLSRYGSWENAKAFWLNNRWW